MTENSSIWHVSFGKPFKIGIDRAREILETGEARFTVAGKLDRRYRLSRFVAKYFPDASPRDSSLT